VEENSYQKTLISSSHQAVFMDEEIVNTEIHDYGSSVINGMPKGQKIKWREFITTSRISILEEYAPTGAQHLKVGDIIEELNKIPENIRKYISIIVLAPFSGDGAEDPFASADWSKSEITIYAFDHDRAFLKKQLADHRTIAHEAGHIIDRNIMRNKGHSSYYLSYTPMWSKAMCADSKLRRLDLDPSLFLISPYAECRQSIGEDFADSVMLFSYETSKELLKENYPNRYKILEEFLEPKNE
jgi:hypothetical protein